MKHCGLIHLDLAPFRDCEPLEGARDCLLTVRLVVDLALIVVCGPSQGHSFVSNGRECARCDVTKLFLSFEHLEAKSRVIDNRLFQLLVLNAANHTLELVWRLVILVLCRRQHQLDEALIVVKILDEGRLDVRSDIEVVVLVGVVAIDNFVGAVHAIASDKVTSVLHRPRHSIKSGLVQ